MKATGSPIPMRLLMKASLSGRSSTPALGVSELPHLSEENFQWQERRFVIYDRGGPYGKNTKHGILPMIERVRRLIDHHFAEHNNTQKGSRTILSFLLFLFFPLNLIDSYRKRKRDQEQGRLFE
jgi:hypothetical protein